MTEIFEVPLFDDDVYKMLSRLAFNLVFASLIVWVAYHPGNRRKNYVFTFLIMNLIVFFVCFTLKKMELGLGMALGLFAVFTVIRYRTDSMRIKEMTYLFVCVGIAVVNALSNKKTSYVELLLVNVILFSAMMLLERFYLIVDEESQNLIYDNIELLKPKNRDQLIQDLTDRTGLDVTRVQVKRINLKSASSELTVYYRTDD